MEMAVDALDVVRVGAQKFAVHGVLDAVAPLARQAVAALHRRHVLDGRAPAVRRAWHAPLARVPRAVPERLPPSWLAPLVAAPDGGASRSATVPPPAPVARKTTGTNSLSVPASPARQPPSEHAPRASRHTSGASNTATVPPPALPTERCAVTCPASSAARAPQQSACAPQPAKLAPPQHALDSAHAACTRTVSTSPDVEPHSAAVSPPASVADVWRTAQAGHAVHVSPILDTHGRDP